MYTYAQGSGSVKDNMEFAGSPKIKSHTIIDNLFREQKIIVKKDKQIKKEITRETKTCNQCHQEPMCGAGDKRYFCPRPRCPNFALLKTPVPYNSISL